MIPYFDWLNLSNKTNIDIGRLVLKTGTDVWLINEFYSRKTRNMECRFMFSVVKNNIVQDLGNESTECVQYLYEKYQMVIVEI